MMARIRSAIETFAPVDVIVSDPAELAERHDDVGSILYWPTPRGSRGVSARECRSILIRTSGCDLPTTTSSQLRLLLTDVELPARMACFHAQQAAEKALKASLVHAAIHFPKTHDLVVLVALQPQSVRSKVSNIDLQQLQQWAVDARYPADLPDITAAEAVAVVAIADQIVAAVAAALQESGPT